LVLRITADRPVQELHLAAEALQFLQEDHQLDIVARQAVGIGDQHPLDLAGPHRVAQPVQTRPVQRRPAVALVPEDILAREFPAVGGKPRPQSVKLLLNGLGLGLSQGRDTHVDNRPHGSPPELGGRWRFPPRAPRPWRPDPSSE
jgi:hypothetical protein